MTLFTLSSLAAGRASRWLKLLPIWLLATWLAQPALAQTTVIDLVTGEVTEIPDGGGTNRLAAPSPVFNRNSSFQGSKTIVGNPNTPARPEVLALTCSASLTLNFQPGPFCAGAGPIANAVITNPSVVSMGSISGSGQIGATIACGLKAAVFELSNASGSFASVTTLASGTNLISASSNFRNASLPTGLASGTGYKIRFRAVDGSYTSNESAAFSILGTNFGFTGTGVTGSSSATNTGESGEVAIKVCQGGSISLSNYSGETGLSLRAQITPSGSPVTYNGSLVTATDQVIAAASVAGIFNASYGPYGLQSGSQGTLTQVYTPFYDGNSNGTQDAGECSGTPITLLIEVNGPPTLSTNLGSLYCVLDPPVALFGSPAGGTFSGPGVSSNMFSPGVAGLGTVSISYTATDPATGCSNTKSQSVTVSGPAVSITINQTNICAGQTLSFDLSSPCPFGSGNVFTVQLSDGNGGFSSPVTLGTATLGSNSLQIPANRLSAAGYKIRVLSSNPSQTSAPSAAFRIYGLAFNVPSIGPSPICQGGTLQVDVLTLGNCNFLSGNVFTAYLSAGNGSFPGGGTNLGVVTLGTNFVQLPAVLPPGDSYRVRIISTAPALTSPASAPIVIRAPSFTSAAPGVGGAPVCQGGTVGVSFATSGNCPYDADNVFIAQLSNASGSFTSPVNLGPVSASGVTQVTIPSGTAAGTRYKIRIVSSSPVQTSSSSLNFQVKVCPTREAAPEDRGLQVQVSPNPAPDGRLKINIAGAEGQALKVALFNPTGQPVRSQAVERASEEEVLDWDISRQPRGLYLLRVSGEKESKTVKVIH